MGNGLKFLIEGADSLNLDENIEECEIKDRDSANKILNLRDESDIDTDLAGVLKRLWQDQGIQEAWKHRAALQVQDTVKYFMENIDRIGNRNYQPTVDDVLRVRNKTTGIVEAKFNI